jgi:hypothetical protein
VCVNHGEWRAASIDYISWIKQKIGLMPTKGYSQQKLNVSGFLSYLKEEEWFRSAETIHVPYGRANNLLYRAVKAICPVIKKSILKTWLIVNGIVEYVVEGKSSHSCCWMYRHDKKYTKGKTI